MKDLIILILGMALIVIIAYYAACFVVSCLTGKGSTEARKIVQNYIYNFLSSHVQHEIEPNLWNDMALQDDIRYIVRSIIGEKNFKELVRLESCFPNTPFLWSGMRGGLSCIRAIVICDSEQQKIQIENGLKTLISNRLNMYRLPSVVIFRWRFCTDAQVPYIEFFFAQSQEQMKVLKQWLNQEKKASIQNRQAVVDDTEEDKLYE